MNIGKRIYYEKLTGAIVLDTGERSGSVIETTVEQDFASYTALAERVPATVGMLQLGYGEYAQDFAECNGYRIDTETQEIIFSYPDPSEPEAPPVFRPSLTETVEALEGEAAMLALELVDTQIRLDQSETDHANLLFELVDKGVL